MGLAAVFAQAVQHGAERAAGTGGQRQRGQRVDGVVAAANAQRVGRHQALDVQLDLGVLAAALRLVGLQRAHQPGHATHHFNAEVAGFGGHVGAEGQHGARLGLRRALGHFGGRCGAHGHDGRVVAVQHHHAVLAKDARLGRCIGRHVAVPVQVVLRDVEHGGGGGLEARHTIELEA